MGDAETIKVEDVDFAKNALFETRTTNQNLSEMACIANSSILIKPFRLTTTHGIG